MRLERAQGSPFFAQSLSLSLSLFARDEIKIVSRPWQKIRGKDDGRRQEAKGHAVFELCTGWELWCRGHSDDLAVRDLIWLTLFSIFYNIYQLLSHFCLLSTCSSTFWWIGKQLNWSQQNSEFSRLSSTIKLENMYHSHFSCINQF